MYIHNMKRTGTSASTRIAGVVIVSALFATALLVGGKTTSAEASTTSSRQAKVGKLGESVPSVTIRHYTFTGYSPAATQKNLSFLKNHVQKMSPLSKANFACTTPTSAPNIQCVVTHVDPAHTKYALQKQRATSVALLSLNAYDGTLSFTKTFLGLSVPAFLKKFIYTQAQNVLHSLYRVAEKETEKLVKLKKPAPVKNWFLVDIYNFHTTKPVAPEKKPLPLHPDRI